MLHNRRAWGYRSHATARSCHKHWHSYQCIIKRSRLVEQLAHHRLYDTKRSYSNSYNEKDTNITHQRSQTHHYNKRKQIRLSKQQDTNYGLRGLHINISHAILFRRPKLLPGNRRLLVDVNVETTFQFGDVLR